MPIYINSEDQHNKYWKYEIDGLKVNIEWGRIGGSSQSQSKTFSHQGELDAFVNKKSREKIKKGYALSDDKKLKKEAKTAQNLGAQHKIKEMKWVSMDDTRLTQIGGYDPKQYVYVEIMNSWSKKVTRLILGKKDTWMVQGSISTSNGNRNISFDRKTKLGYSQFATAVREYLKEMSEVVAAALKSVKFAAVGARNLFDDDGGAQMSDEVTAALANIDTGSMDASVVSKFAGMGSRTLDF
jgi:predicted DNA-binding WGR domain protein